MEYRINKVTGAPECVTVGKLISVSDTIKELKNKKKTQYRTGIVDLEIVSEDGEITYKTTWCNIYEKQYQRGMEIGKEYQAVVTEMSDGVLITLYSSVEVEKLSPDLFNFSNVESPIDVEKKVLEAMRS